MSLLPYEMSFAFALSLLFCLKKTADIKFKSSQKWQPFRFLLEKVWGRSAVGCSCGGASEGAITASTCAAAVGL